MKYYIDFNTKKVHSENCWCARDFKKGEGWQKYKALKDVIKACKKDGRKFRYCGNCLREYKKAVVK